MIEYYTSLVNKYGDNGKLSGHFLKGVAIVCSDNTYTFEFKANREFTNQQSSIIPSIQIIKSLGKYKLELTEEEKKTTMDVEQKEIFAFILNTIDSIEVNNEKN